MAYLSEIYEPHCGCGARASQRLINAQNAAVGTFCKRCGSRELKRLLEQEAKWWREKRTEEELQRRQGTR